ncbi:uncharacterized protein LOC142544600 isoform X2 [Primulina tabacum]|uniref:uncharacterized protein LOC142544600 isoform X2 n=1 Tax=Primulina tabacum TaxID=48773 RepID=UPI003F59AEC6
MDSEPFAKSDSKAPRKVKFAPKAPIKKELKPTLPKVEKVESDIDEAQAQQLLRRLHESSFKEKAKVQRKVETSQVAFGYGGQSYSIKSFGTPKFPPKFMKTKQGSSSNGDDNTQVAEKEYKEPWDYYTNYPVTLPLRRPYSGNPELLDEEEFGEVTDRLHNEEHESKSTVDLDLMEDEQEKRMIFLQLPATMPILKQSSNAEGENQDKNLKNLEKGGKSSQKLCGLEALPAGLMGKMLVYKSGAVKLKLGGTLYDVWIVLLDRILLPSIQKRNIVAILGNSINAPLLLPTSTPS